jgi:hypothetical protein
METVSGKMYFSNSDGQWEESFDVVESLTQVLLRGGIAASRRANRLRLDAEGFTLSPVLVDIQPLHPRGARTVTIIRVNHSKIEAENFFEYQHSAGNSIEESLQKGFDQWMQMDLVTLQDSLQPKPLKCMMIEMPFPATAERPARIRRAVLGPVAHMRSRQPSQEEEHPFCACCLLMKNCEAFKHFLEGDGFFGMRLFAMRGEDGKAAADCRVNGDEYDPGKEALRKYVETWPDLGVEFRKQYVIVQTIEQTAKDVKVLWEKK